MSAHVTRRRGLRTVMVRALPLVILVGLTATLAIALQVRQVRVEGVRSFPARDVEQALHTALGTPTFTARPEALRALARTVPWVDDARVRVSLDGIVVCTVTERSAVALEVDGGHHVLLDATGALLGPAGERTDLLELDGFGPYPEERAAVLAAARRLERAWTAKLVKVARVSDQDVEVTFADTPCAIVLDPNEPSTLLTARAVLEAWRRQRGGEPLRIDARIAERLAVLPAPTPPVEGAS